MKWQNKGHEFDSIAPIILAAAKKDVYIWGAGYFGDAVYRGMNRYIHIVGYIDSSEEKQGTKMNGVQVFSPSKLETVDSDSVTVIVATGYTKQVFESLNIIGFVRNQHYYYMDEFCSIFMFYQHEKIFLLNSGVAITDFCTLKCEKCLTLTPYIKMPKHRSVAEIADDLRMQFKVVNCSISFVIGGGDAMSNPKCREIIEYIGENYYSKGKINSLELSTNAIIVPDNAFIETLKHYDVCCRFTDYGTNVPRQKINHIIDIFIKNGIRYNHKKLEYWVDGGYPQESNGITGEEALQQHFQDCELRSCQSVFDGRFYFCMMVKYAEKAGYCNADADDYLELTPELNKAEFLEFAAGYSSKGYYNFCKKCAGSINSNAKRIQPGVQMKKSPS